MTRSLLLLTTLFASACAADQGERDYTRDPNRECTAEGLYMTGAFDHDPLSVGTITVSGRIVGVLGLDLDSNPTRMLSLVAADSLEDELASVGVYDVATTNIRHLISPVDDESCEESGACKGFLAKAGTFEVLEVSPYRARFVLDELYTYDGVTEGPERIQETVTGCLNAAE